MNLLQNGAGRESAGRMMFKFIAKRPVSEQTRSRWHKGDLCVRLKVRLGRFLA